MRPFISFHCGRGSLRTVTGIWPEHRDVTIRPSRRTVRALAHITWKRKSRALKPQGMSAFVATACLPDLESPSASAPRQGVICALGAEPHGTYSARRATGRCHTLHVDEKTRDGIFAGRTPGGQQAAHCRVNVWLLNEPAATRFCGPFSWLARRWHRDRDRYGGTAAGHPADAYFAAKELGTFMHAQQTKRFAAEDLTFRYSDAIVHHRER